MAQNFTITISPTFGNKTGKWQRNAPTNINDCTVAQLAQCLLLGPFNLIGNSTLDLPGLHTLSFFLNSDNIVLSGGSIYDGTYTFATLPAGWTPTACTFSVEAFNASSLTWTAQLSSTTGGTSPVFNDPNGTISLVYNPVPTAFELSTDAVQLAMEGFGGTNGWSSRNWTITGTFEIQDFGFTLDRSTQPLQSGSSVTVTPEDPNPLVPPDIDTLEYVYIDENGAEQTVPIPNTFWTTVTASSFVFTIPPGLPADATVLEFFITSTQFSGSVSLGRLITIFFENAPGVYTLVPGKTTDTLYDVLHPGDTLEVKIPDPFFKAGYIGG